LFTGPSSCLDERGEGIGNLLPELRLKHNLSN
jgi:hypothetical protein